MTIRNLSAAELARLLADDAAVLIDVREEDEFALEHIRGAQLHPLSTFDPLALPAADGRLVVFQCGSGVRSAKVVAICRRAGLAHDAHLKGGIQAWKAAGLPVER